MPRAQVNDVDFYYELHGNGPSLILISGYTRNHSAWDNSIQFLEKHFQILIFDNQGIGQTKDHNGPLIAEAMADNIVELAIKLGLEHPFVAGSSMGGTIAQKIASRHGNKIKKVALLVTTAKWRKATLMGLRTPLTLWEKNLDFESIFHSAIPWGFGEDFLSDPKKLDTLKQMILEDPYPQSLENQKRQYNILAQFDGRKDLAQIKVPTLILYTKEDIIALPYEAKFLAKHIPHSTLIECSGGHDITTENPELASKHLKEFFLGS